MRVSARAEAGFLIVSTWKADTCVATVRLLPAEAAELVAGLATARADMTAPAETMPRSDTPSCLDMGTV